MPHRTVANRLAPVACQMWWAVILFDARGWKQACAFVSVIGRACALRVTRQVACAHLLLSYV